MPQRSLVDLASADHRLAPRCSWPRPTRATWDRHSAMHVPRSHTILTVATAAATAILLGASACRRGGPVDSPCPPGVPRSDAGRAGTCAAEATVDTDGTWSCSSSTGLTGALPTCTNAWPCSSELTGTLDTPIDIPVCRTTSPERP